MWKCSALQLGGQSADIEHARPTPNLEPPPLSQQSGFLPDVSPAKHLACGCRQSQQALTGTKTYLPASWRASALESMGVFIQIEVSCPGMLPRATGEPSGAVNTASRVPVLATSSCPAGAARNARDRIGPQALPGARPEGGSAGHRTPKCTEIEEGRPTPFS